jgi:hypothetical protein
MNVLPILKTDFVEICEAILKLGLKIKWGCEARVNSVDFEMLKAMKQAGLRELELEAGRIGHQALRRDHRQGEAHRERHGDRPHPGRQGFQGYLHHLRREEDRQTHEHSHERGKLRHGKKGYREDGRFFVEFW